MRKEIIDLIHENIALRDKLSDKIQKDKTHLDGYSRLHLSVVVRLHLSGRAKLKDIAHREGIANSNLCSCFRNLEKDGLVSRTVDENDRRNTWYSVTESGEALAKKALDVFKKNIETVFKSLSKDDEERLIGAMKITNEILQKMENQNV